MLTLSGMGIFLRICCIIQWIFMKGQYLSIEVVKNFHRSPLGGVNADGVDPLSLVVGFTAQMNAARAGSIFGGCKPLGHRVFPVHSSMLSVFFCLPRRIFPCAVPWRVVLVLVLVLTHVGQIFGLHVLPTSISSERRSWLIILCIQLVLCYILMHAVKRICIDIGWRWSKCLCKTTLCGGDRGRVPTIVRVENVIIMTFLPDWKLS